MRVHRKAHADLLGIEPSAVIVAILGHVHEPWKRNLELEASINRDSSGIVGGEYLCIELHDSMSGLPKSNVWLYLRPGKLVVANIVPVSSRELSVDQYNRILAAFFDDCLQPGCRDVGITATISSESFDISNQLPPSAVHALRQFCLLANKYTGSANSHDRRRWFAFLISAASPRNQLDSYSLQQWLIEDAGFPDNVAVDLAEEYELGIALLRFKDGHE